MLTFVVRRRLRGAAVFTGASIAIVAPWMGWSLAHATNHPYYSGASYAATSILTSLALSEKLHVLGTNVLLLLASPFTLLTGLASMYAVLATLVLLVWGLVRRRQLVPDLFLILYAGMLLCWAGPPLRFVAPVLPLVLWILWRAFRNVKRQEALAAFVAILAGLGLWADAGRVRETLLDGQFPTSDRAPSDWAEMSKLFAFIRANTPADAVILANLDPVFYLNTGRKAVRGFSPDGYKLYYGNPKSAVTPDELFGAITANGVSYVALTPDRDFAEAPAYHQAVGALERGGILEPVAVPGLGADYRLLRTVSLRFR
jgi:hypothetical protein